MRHRWTAGDGLVDKIIGNDIRSRILPDIQISLGKELPREPRRAAKMSFGMSAPKRALVVEAPATKATVGRWAEIVARNQLRNERGPPNRGGLTSHQVEATRLAPAIVSLPPPAAPQANQSV